MKKRLWVIAAAIAGTLVFLLANATANTSLFANNYPLLLALNAILVVGLLGLVVWQFRELRQEYKAKVFGSRLKLKLLAMFGAMGLIPGLIVYAVSLQFALKSIESWFDLRVDSALESGINISRNALDFLVDKLSERARSMALELTDGSHSVPQLERLREQTDADTATILSLSGRIIATSAAARDQLVPDPASSSQIRQAKQGHYRAIEGDASTGLVLRVIVAIPGRSLSGEERYLQLTQSVPQEFAHNAQAVEEVYRDYQELALGRNGLRQIYLLTLTLTLLFALLGATVVAYVLARRLAAPLAILAEGTQAVAQGDFSQRLAISSRDELGILTHSFNRMTRQLDEARASADKSRHAVETAKAYLESVLANISGGVLAFDHEQRLRAVNKGACDILGDQLEGFEELKLAIWPTLDDFRNLLLNAFQQDSELQHQEFAYAHPDGSQRTLLVHTASLPAATGGGWVVVFDDITQLITAQRTAAWGEVARRLAHEIKNPLTPIQLSAERLQMKLEDRLDETGRKVLERSTSTIIAQVEAMKNLVNAFRDYAKMPTPEVKPHDLNQVLREILVLYESSRVSIRTQLAEDLPSALMDIGQIRQVIHNLLQNSEDALVDEAEPEVVINTQLVGHTIELRIQDNGPGFSTPILARAFEPYVTSKTKGTGLGLAIVKKIIDEHQGEIRISNRPEHGAEIRVRLPIAEPLTPNLDSDGTL